MSSRYLGSLTKDQRADLERRLLELQGGKCFICGDPLDLKLEQVDVDHVEPLGAGGKDNPDNFALAHAQCNRSKQASDLRVARLMAKFSKIQQRCHEEYGRGPTLGDLLKEHAGAQKELKIELTADSAKYALETDGTRRMVTERVYLDPLSGMRYFFGLFPLAYLHHDEKINPRSIGTSMKGLLEEFHKRRPQLHVSLGWIHPGPDAENGNRINVFDGQHKAAAQILLGAKELPVRVFVSPDLDVLLQTNTNAGYKLRQIAFDKSVQRHLGSSLFTDRLSRYQSDHNLAPDDESFSEKDLVAYFRGESREMRRYIIDAVRDGITHSPDNKLKDYIDLGGRGKEKPLSYSSVEKTFHFFFIFPDLLETPLNYRMDEGENPREIEKSQIVQLMNIFAEEVLVDRFDMALGTDRIENKVQRGEDVPDDHLRAFRMCKEEILYAWLNCIKQIVQSYFVLHGTLAAQDKLFQYRFPDQLWKNLRNFIRNLAKLPMWVNHELSLTVFGAKQTYPFWQTILETGKSPNGQQVMARGIEIMELVKEP